MAGRLVVVSNRVAPITEGEPTAGGLAAGVMDALKVKGGIWFGWSGNTVAGEPSPASEHRLGGVTLHTIDLPKKEYDDYYNGFANGTLWPVLHYRPILATFEASEFAGYRRVNERFARALAELIQPYDLIWCHDYHLFCLAEALRALGLTNRIGLFLHTPFPAPQVLMSVPAYAELIRSLCEYDLIGFQTATDEKAFRDIVVEDAGGVAVGKHGVRACGRMVRTGVYPIGVHVDEVRAAAVAPANAAIANTRMMATLGGGQLVISVDRLDYSKGLRQRFRSFERFLEEFPERRGMTTFLQIAPPSRTDIATYKTLRTELEAEAGRINGRFADLDWTPLRYINRGFARSLLMPLYASARVGLVTPLRDGMNLVAKEYVAAQDPDDPGMLVLSQFAGAARELDAAIVVNPFDSQGVARAIDQALAMSLAERQERHAAMMAVMRRNNLDRWRERFTRELQSHAMDGGALT
jgi:trehalose 6-phosphate synthase